MKLLDFDSESKNAYRWPRRGSNQDMEDHELTEY